MDLLLVNPSLDWEEDQRGMVARRVNPTIANQESPHIGVGYLLSAARTCGLTAQCVDMVMDSVTVDALLDLVRHTRPSLVGFTAFTVQIKAAAEIAARIQTLCLGVRTCVGGAHATGDPAGTLREFPAFDFVVAGEAEGILGSMYDGEFAPGVYRRGQSTLPPHPIDCLDYLAYPAWDQFDLAKYPGFYPHRTRLELPMVTGRGCPFRCTFCCRALGSYTRRRRVENVIGEIWYNVAHYGCESIVFEDETFILDKEWTSEFLAKVPRSITWSCSTRVSNVTPELLRQMAAAGCYYIFYGLESATDATLRRIRKGITVEQIRNAVRWTKEAGIVPVGAFILGLPGDGEAEVMRSIELAEELDLYSSTFPIAVPFPGTAMREQLTVLSDDWSRYGKQDGGVAQNEYLTADRLKEMQALAYSRNPKKDYDEYRRHIGL